MFRKSVLAVFCVLVLGPVWSALAGMDPDLVVYWPFDEGSGTVATDLTGNGNDGTISAGPTWVDGYIGGALRFAGAGDVRGPHIPLDNRTFTITMWVNPSLTGSQIIFSEVQSGSTNLSMHFRLGGTGSTDAPVNGIRFGFYSNDTDSPANILTPNAWAHITFWYDYEARVRKIYLNGVQVAQQTSVGPFLATTGAICVGSWTGSSYFTGMIDDFQLYHKALSDTEILKSMLSLGDTSLADGPSPEDKAIDVLQDVVVSWTPGEFAATHDVYFGTSFADVNDASRANALGVLVSQDQADAAYDPEGLLEFGQTYYWRVDEVNGAPDNTIFKGATWSFTAEPFAYPVTPVTATASSAQPGMTPLNTINGSGLNADDQHGVEATQMWMTNGAKPAWIQYDFDKAYKLDRLLVWNSNQLIEGFIGFGAKDVTIEYSTDGATWATLEGVPEFAKAAGSPTYTANTTVDFGGALAQYVKLTINANWGGVAPQTGLAEVRFFQIPVQAREPVPADGTTGVSVNTEFNWRPGREATSHEVLFGTDANAVAAGTVSASTVADHSYLPTGLEFGTTYFWKVNEVGGDGPYAGDVWSFVSQELAVIDDFEAYNDDDHRIYESWIDGVTTGASGSTVGYLQAPFAEQTIKNSGAQSMPLAYDNSASPFLSEAELTFDTAQNWTTNGADSVVVSFRGQAPGFVELASGNILMSAIGADIWNTADEFRYAYKTLNGDGTMVARVESIGNSNAWAKGGVMIRQSIEPSTVHAFMPITPGGSGAGNGASFQHRLTLGGASTNNDNTGAVVGPPYWVKIVRKGNDFTGFISPDGATWTQLGTAQTIVMNGPVLIGLALCSHDAAIATSAEFSNISTTGNVTGAWQVAEIGVPQPVGNSMEGLYLSVTDSSGKSKVVQHPDAAATANMSWQQWQIPLSEFTAAGVKMNAVKSLVIGVGNKASPTTGGAGTVYIDDIGYGRPFP